MTTSPSPQPADGEREVVSFAERTAAMRARVAADRKRNRCIPCTWGDMYDDPHNPADPACEGPR